MLKETAVEEDDDGKRMASSFLIAAADDSIVAASRANANGVEAGSSSVDECSEAPPVS